MVGSTTISMTSEKTVAEFYNITDHEIRKLAELREPYYYNVRDFWWQVRDLPLSQVSPARKFWLQGIENELDRTWRPFWYETEGEDHEFT